MFLPVLVDRRLGYENTCFLFFPAPVNPTLGNKTANRAHATLRADNCLQGFRGGQQAGLGHGAAWVHVAIAGLGGR